MANGHETLLLDTLYVQTSRKFVHFATKQRLPTNKCSSDATLSIHTPGKTMQFIRKLLMLL